MTRTTKLLAAILSLLLLVTAGGFLAHRQYRISLLKDKLNEAMGKDAGYAETILKIEESEKITYGEIFELCDKSVEGRTNLIIELRGAYPGIDDGLKDELVAYLNKENGFARATKAFYRTRMELNSAYETFREDNITYISADYFQQEYKRQKNALRKAASEAVESASSFLEQYAQSLAEEKKFMDRAARAGIQFKPVFSQFEKTNKKVGEESLELARVIQKSVRG